MNWAFSYCWKNCPENTGDGKSVFRGVVQDSIYVTLLVSMICDINDSASLVVGHSDGIHLSLPKCSDRFY